MDNNATVIYENKRTGKQGQMTGAEWKNFLLHPVMRGKFRKIRTIPAPEAAREAEQNKAEADSAKLEPEEQKDKNPKAQGVKKVIKKSNQKSN